jgi:HAD superfamily hydrolase (TIGR01509 family)
MLKAIIFDVDGTLVDTRDFHIDSWIKAFKKFGVDVSVERVQSQFGRRAVEIARDLLPEDEKQYAEAVAKEKRALYSSYLPLVKPYSKVRELLNILHEKGIKVALATSTVRMEANYYVNMLSANDLIGAVVTAEDIKYSKPDPEIFLTAAKKLGVEPAVCAGIGDSPHDMAAAKAAGMTTIGVLTGGYDDETLREAGADEVYPSVDAIFSKIVRILENTNTNTNT